MIQGFNDYEKTEVKTFEKREKIELGGHICKILEVKLDTITSKKDGKTYNVLRIKFDIEEPDEQAGFYQRRYVEEAQKDALNAKWKGNHSITIPSDSSEDFIKERWKGFLTSIEKSNPGVELDGTNGFDENILVGKKFGGVFGLEEFTLPTDGRTITFTRIRFVRSTENIKDCQIPSVKLLDGTYVKYDEYMDSKADKENAEDNATETTISQVDDLPF